MQLCFESATLSLAGWLHSMNDSQSNRKTGMDKISEGDKTILTYFNAKVDGCLERVAAAQLVQVVGMSYLRVCVYVVFNLLARILSWSD